MPHALTEKEICQKALEIRKRQDVIRSRQNVRAQQIRKFLEEKLKTLQEHLPPDLFQEMTDVFAGVGALGEEYEEYIEGSEWLIAISLALLEASIPKKGPTVVFPAGPIQ